MILTEKAYAISASELEALLALEAQLISTDIKLSNTAIKTHNQIGQSAVISLNGPLFPQPNIFTLFGFGTALSSIQQQLEQAVLAAQVDKIILNIDSPGGSITGINELANTIKAINKPITAYVGGTAASAAFWLASACDEIVCDATAMLGSVGVVGIFRKNNKDKIEIVSSRAKDKRPNVETDEGKAVILKTINDLETVFIGALTELRPRLSEHTITALNGDVLIGEWAVDRGLADRLGSLQGVIESRKTEHQSDSSANKAHTENNINAWSEAIASVTQMAQPANVSAMNTNTADNNNAWIAAFAKAGQEEQQENNTAIDIQATTDEASWERAFAQAVKCVPQPAKITMAAENKTVSISDFAKEGQDKQQENDAAIHAQNKADPFGWDRAFASVQSSKSS